MDVHRTAVLQQEPLKSTKFNIYGFQIISDFLNFVSAQGSEQCCT
jgi:hypothetical protein